MSVPMATTTITVLRAQVDVNADYYDARPERQPVVSGVPAHISQPSGIERVVGGREEEVSFPFHCDPCDVNGNDLIRDDQTGETYEVRWVRQRRGLGLDHMVGRLVQHAGQAA